ncbi:hypothetical protein DFH09DRAFT_1087359 [Mycena vulgaris]|nr:hypothetical protein DFH09DRAFT_1087281 [Mycena vulgaris]KAJ6548246.1 hypothetical protein DFH09DRAFT_1087359 [Mycena vulgaris]
MLQARKATNYVPISTSLRQKEKLGIHKALKFLGDFYLAEGDQQTAISLFTTALEGFTKMDVHRSGGECMVRLGDISKQNGDAEKAVELWRTARPLFEHSSQAKQIVQIDDRLAGVGYSLPEEHFKSMVSLSDLNGAISGLEELAI